MAGERIDVGMVAVAVLRREGHIQPALLAKENALLVLQIVQQLARRICLRQRTLVKADRISRLAAFRHLA